MPDTHNPIIVALDGKPLPEVLELARKLQAASCILKVNDLLLDEGIKHLMPVLAPYGRVMADFKGHDIPNTVENYCKRFRDCPPWAVTVHASGGRKMIEAAVRGLEGTDALVLVVTILTSIGEKECEEIYDATPLDQVETLCKIAKEGGASGIVCSPKEISVVRNAWPDAVIVTPGVRSPGKDTHDQQRVDTPAAAIARGANCVVMGRQILEEEDPAAEVERVLDEIRNYVPPQGTNFEHI